MSIAIDFDKPRQLKFDLAAIKDLEAQLGGQPLGTIVQHLSKMGVSTLITALWAGMKHEDRSLTPNLVTKLLETYIKKGKRVKPLMDAVSDAIEESGLFKAMEDETPDLGEDDTDPNPKPEQAAALQK